MSALEVLRAKRSEIQSTAAKHGAGNLRVFGEAQGETQGAGGTRLPYFATAQNE
jgi:carbon monoxide dehydrogenase subunit G